MGKKLLIIVFALLIGARPATARHSGNTKLYLGLVEILDHCVTQDELLGCEEFTHASRLTPQRCEWALAQAHALCTIISAPANLWDYLQPRGAVKDKQMLHPEWEQEVEMQRDRV